MATPMLLGVRHHGPGSARAVRRALSACRPEIVLVEGPPEADPLVDLAGHEDMRAPVALLGYAAAAGAARAPGAAGPSRPNVRTANQPVAFWPLAEFSPEWQAIRWAAANEVPVRFIDLPVAVRLAIDSVEHQRPVPAGIRVDPIAALAEAAGYDDPERWWEDAIEHRLSDADAPGTDVDQVTALAPFAAIAEAMRAVRASNPPQPGPEGLDQERREASMRRALRAAVKEYDRVAVVCGAWHVPALSDPLPPANADASTLRGLPKIRVTMTWVPWTHARMASALGYGAGVSAPGWYHHLFTAPDHPVARWLVRAAAVLRRNGTAVSSDHVIEATRLSETLATVRGRPLAGLAEVTEAARAVLCDGDELRLALINRRLVVGDRLGRVPETTPGVPIVRDVSAAQRRLRLPPDPLPREIDLDLRREIDLERSRLLHRLLLLGIEWGQTLPQRRGLGTFWESWRLGWQPEFAVDLVAAGTYGTTVPDAAAARVAELATAAASLADVTTLVERCLLADLAAGLPGLLAALRERVALDHDVAHLMEALPALARTLRYGDVRNTDTGALREAATGLVTRICVGLPGALCGLDERAARAMRERVDAVHASIGLLDDAEAATRWRETLGSLAAVERTPSDRTAPGAPGTPHGLLAGRLNRLLLDGGVLDADEARRRMRLTLTIGVPAEYAAAWVEGFLAGDGRLLVHDERLLHLVDEWITSIPQASFTEVLPLLRRTFSGYSAPERRMIGERAAHLGRGGGYEQPGAEPIDADRGGPMLVTVARLLGWPHAG
ncbi:MAG: hypothetical protein HKP61_16930 [Dactylosporangium sp.]|nr:hypothetical protein [Dactylosporangium sp.]